jgi:hypothetical protein
MISAWWLLLCFPAAWLGMLVMALCAMAGRETPKQGGKLSCPSCEAVRDVIEVRHMLCTVCHNEFETPEQLDASLDAERNALEEVKRG